LFLPLSWAGLPAIPSALRTILPRRAGQAGTNFIRAIAGLHKKHDRVGSPPRSNPGTGAWRLIDQISGQACEPDR
jgi:hypothetical protein